MKRKFACVHLGARSHYLVPAAMELKGILGVLITDTWVASAVLRSILLRLPMRQLKSLSSRFLSKIDDKHVSSFNIKFLLVELFLRLSMQDDWKRILYRNRRFQEAAVKEVARLPMAYTVFCASYTALEVFKIAKKRGQKTVLFQIDPGLKEEEIVSQAVIQQQEVYPTVWEKAPASYWVDWQKECELADCIMVNSEWSKLNLLEYGVSLSKIKVVNLPFKIEPKHLHFRKIIPESFHNSRPMRCLFLGTLCLRKGIHLVLEAAAELRAYPIEFVLVGNSEMYEASFGLSNVVYKGVATRAETDLYYQEADVFLFPTLSDGFGLTQLEAMAWKLPVISSKNCGKVVEHLVNGFELEFCSTEAIIKAILYFLHNPSNIRHMATNCLPTVKQFNLEKFSEELSDLL